MTRRFWISLALTVPLLSVAMADMLPGTPVERVVSGPQVRWTLVPENTMKFARFMQTTGMLKVAPESWRDYFFPEIHALNGS